MPTVIRSEKHKDLTPWQLVDYFDSGIRTWAFDVIDYLLSWGNNCASDIPDEGSPRKFRTVNIRGEKGNLDLDLLKSESVIPNGDFVIADRLCSLVEVIAMCKEASPHFEKGLQIIHPTMTVSKREKIKNLIRNPLAHEITTRRGIQFDRKTKNFEEMKRLNGDTVYNVCVPEWYDEICKWFSDYVKDLRDAVICLDIEKDIKNFDKEYKSKVKKKSGSRTIPIRDFIQDKNDFQRLYIFTCHPDEDYTAGTKYFAVKYQGSSYGYRRGANPNTTNTKIEDEIRNMSEFQAFCGKPDILTKTPDQLLQICKGLVCLSQQKQKNAPAAAPE